MFHAKSLIIKFDSKLIVSKRFSDVIVLSNFFFNIYKYWYHINYHRVTPRLPSLTFETCGKTRHFLLNAKKNKYILLLITRTRVRRSHFTVKNLSFHLIMMSSEESNRWKFHTHTKRETWGMYLAHIKSC